MVISHKNTVWPTNILGEARNQKHNTQASLKFVAKRNLDQWTYRVERRENSDANYIFSPRLKYTLLDHWPKHVNIRTFFVFRGPQNAGKSRNQFHIDIVQSLNSAVAFKICKHNVFHKICHSKMLLFVAVHSKHIYPVLLFAFHSKHI